MSSLMLPYTFPIGWARVIGFTANPRSRTKFSLDLNDDDANSLCKVVNNNKKISLTSLQAWNKTDHDPQNVQPATIVDYVVLHLFKIIRTNLQSFGFVWSKNNPKVLIHDLAYYPLSSYMKHCHRSEFTGWNVVWMVKWGAVIYFWTINVNGELI